MKLTLIQELKQKEVALLNSSRDQFHEYGAALAWLLKKYRSYGKRTLSDEMLLSDLAQEFIDEELKKGPGQANPARIRFMIQFIEKRPLALSEIKAHLPKDRRFTFEEARDYLSTSYPEAYKKIKPALLLEALLDRN